MSLLRRLTSVLWVPLRQSKRLLSSENIPTTLNGDLVSKAPIALSYRDKYYRLKTRLLYLKVGSLGCLIVAGIVVWRLCKRYEWEIRDEFELKNIVCRRFKDGHYPKGLREDGYIQRDVQDEITAAFCDKDDTHGMFGIQWKPSHLLL